MSVCVAGPRSSKQARQDVTEWQVPGKSVQAGSMKSNAEHHAAGHIALSVNPYDALRFMSVEQVSIADAAKVEVLCRSAVQVGGSVHVAPACVQTISGSTLDAAACTGDKLPAKQARRVHCMGCSSARCS